MDGIFPFKKWQPKIMEYYPEVSQVIPTLDYKVYVYFSDGKIILFDANEMIQKGRFAVLKDKEIFINSCSVLNGSLAWSVDGSYSEETCIDVDPFLLYECSEVEEPENLNDLIMEIDTKNHKIPNVVNSSSIKPVIQFSKDEIKELRTRLGYTQKKFSELLGISKKTLEAWEAGTNIPNGSSARLLQMLNENSNVVLDMLIV